MKKFLFALLLMIVLPVYASHIVGGEFELIHLNGYNYQLNMILYFDDLNGAPRALDNNVVVSFYRKRDNVFITNLTLPLISRTPVSYTQPACASGLLETDRLFYSASITLSPDTFNDAAGYYVSWQRCCRNYNITNIYSEVPPGGISAGQTFYMEFPPVIKNGQPFVNSSPHLFPPLSDYGCPGRPYYVNFAGVDDDGDSIVYSLTTPLNTTQPISLPPASPAPYPEVQWRPGYSLTNIVGGAPDLRISTDGLLTCTPVIQGLFVFAVKVEEYRNKVKIGETRRDFQLLVTNGCEPDLPPQIIGKKLTDASFTYSKTMAISFTNTVTDNNRCLMVRVADPDSQDPLHNFTENISIRAVALNFKSSKLNSILPTITNATLTHGSTQDFTICFPQCPFLKVPYQIGIIAFDDACSLPLSDTLKITVNEQPPFNTNAFFLPQKLTTAQLNEGGSGSWPFAAQDADGDNLVFSVVTDNFVLKNAGMTFNILNQQPGSANGTLDWNAICKLFEFSKKTNFTVKVLVDDQDLCKNVNPDTAVFHLKVILPNINPKLTIFNATHTQNLTNDSLVVNLGHLELDLVGIDTYPSTIDTLKLSLLNASGNVVPIGYTFADAIGLHTVDSKFLWDPTCSIFKSGSYDNHYEFKFVVANDHCKTPISDTASVKLRIKDIESTDKNFIPANVITTHPDHCNDFFAIEGFESEPDCNGQPRQVPQPPVDNCSNRFEHVKIYDRWGKQVFESAERKFRWYAQSESAGVYYCIIQFTRREYKSTITVIH